MPMTWIPAGEHLVGAPVSAAYAQDARIDAAISWASARLGSHSWDNLCLRFASDAYQYGAATSVTRYDSAGAAADALGARSRKALEPPRGAFVFYDSANGGHVGISLGDGRIIHDYGYEGVVITSRSLSLSYIGWAPPPVSPPITDWVRRTRSLADFNGDGKADIAAIYDYGGGTSRIHVWRSTGSGFAYQGPSGWWNPGSGYAASSVTGRVVASH